MTRTEKLDEHWYGYYWCETCQFYTGQPQLHKEHKLFYLGRCPTCQITFIGPKRNEQGELI